MIEDLTPFVAYAIALGIAAVIPGPGVAAVVGRALGHGSSFAFIFGLAVGDVVYLTVAVLGLSALAAAASGVFFAVKIAGGAYLVYLAWRVWTAEVVGSHVDVAPAQNPVLAALSGLAVTLGNPKTVVFYLALLPNVLDLSAVDVMDWTILSALTFAVLFAVLLPYALLAQRLRQVLTKPRALRRLNRTASVLIGGAGALILRDAVMTQVR